MGTIEIEAGDISELTEKIKAVGGGIRLTVIRKALPELKIACERKINATQDFAAACKTVAVNAGIDAGVLQAFVSAAVRDKLEEKQARAQQLSLLFNEIEA